MSPTLRIGINELHERLLADDPVSAYESCAILLRTARSQPGTDLEVLKQLRLLLTELATCWRKGMDYGRRRVFCQAVAAWPLFKGRLN